MILLGLLVQRIYAAKFEDSRLTEQVSSLSRSSKPVLGSGSILNNDLHAWHCLEGVTRRRIVHTSSLLSHISDTR